MHPMITKLRSAGVNVDKDVTGIWCSQDRKSWAVSLGDWASEDTAKAVRSVIKDVEIDAEFVPDRKKYPIRVKSITTKPFASRRQLRKCYALLKQGKTSWDCAKWLKETENVKKLPESVAKKEHTGIIIALYPDEESTNKIQEISRAAFGEEVEDVHLTLKYLGKVDRGEACFECLARAVLSTALSCSSVDGLVSGVGRFFNEDEQAVYLSVDSKDVLAVYNHLCMALGVEDASEHGFDPHITIGYSEQTPNIQFSQFPIKLDTIALCYGDIHMKIPLVGQINSGPELYPEEPTKMSYRSKAVWTTAYVNDLPDSAFLYVEPGKKVNGRAFPLSKRHFPYKDASGKVDLPHLRNAIARIPQSNAPGLNKAAVQARARKLLGSSNKSVMSSIKGSLTVFKQADGKLRWVLFSSNPYKDKDDEYVTQLAHERDISVLDKENYNGQVLRLWHVGEPYFDDINDWTTVKAGPGADIGQCDFAAMHGRIRIESGTFYNETDGQAIADHADELEASLAFAHPKRQPDRRGGFLNIKSFERSLTPRDMASNPFTSLMVSKEETIMDAKKLKAFKDLGVDIDKVLNGAEKVQKKADRTAPFRMKANAAVDAVEEAEDEEDDEGDISAKLDKLTMQMQALQQTIKEGDTALEPEERLEDLLVAELTVGELQDIVNSAVSTKSIEPIGIALKAIIEEIEEIKTLLTSKSVQSVVDEVARMKAKLERQSARLKATASKVRELDEEKPRILHRGMRPSESDDTLLLDDDDAELSAKSSSANPFSWIDEFIQKPEAGR